MRKLTALLAFILVSVFAVQAQSQVKQCTVKSKILGVEKMYSVYLPDGYEKSGKNYPVLYLLHGARGNELSWITKGNLLHNIDSLTAFGLMKETIT